VEKEVAICAGERIEVSLQLPAVKDNTPKQ